MVVALPVVVWAKTGQIKAVLRRVKVSRVNVRVETSLCRFILVPSKVCSSILSTAVLV
jgi:hypothetical protein